jgi:mono/diheme cytochrome c family protein
MKFLFILILTLWAFTLVSCNFSLASDITPPPDFVSPTPMPTLGALFPAAAPDVQNGAALFSQNCSACHGDKGLGDGPQSMQLPVTVPGLGLPEVAHSASPADWFKMVTQGNLDRFMPPFVGALTDQERWDVISYVFTLHTTPDQIAQGKALFEANCPGCAAKFGDQTSMAALSENDLEKIIKNGEAGIPPFGKNFSDGDAYAVAAYLRTLTFASPSEAAASTVTAGAVATPSTGNGTPEVSANLSSTPAATVAAGIGVVSGSVQMSNGSPAANLTVNLQGFDNAQNQANGPQEALNLTAQTSSDGSFKFENVAVPEGRIFLAEVEYAGIKYHSGVDTAKANSTAITLSPIKLYESSSDLSLLKVSQVHIYTDFATAGTVQVIEIIAFSNPSDKSIVISTDGTSLPLIKLPDGAQNADYQAGQDSAPLVIADKGIAVVPTATPYSIIAFFNLPYADKLDINQSFAIDTPSLILLIPDGINVNGAKLLSKGVQVIQNNSYQEFSSNELKAGDPLSFSLSGQPRSSSAAGQDPRQWILIGGGILGILLIVAGVFLFLRDRRPGMEIAQGAEFGSTDEVMDAILALDDLHRAGKISDQAYQNRRGELKETLKEMS